MGYANAASLPADARARLAVLVPGVIRTQLERLCTHNAGPTYNEFFLRKPVDHDRVIALRVALRPYAMPEAIYADPVQRRTWLFKYSPAPDPRDVVMKVSRPFLSHTLGS